MHLRNPRDFGIIHLELWKKSCSEYMKILAKADILGLRLPVGESACACRGQANGLRRWTRAATVSPIIRPPAGPSGACGGAGGRLLFEHV
jgi:hypothetical protein